MVKGERPRQPSGNTDVNARETTGLLRGTRREHLDDALNDLVLFKKLEAHFDQASRFSLTSDARSSEQKLDILYAKLKELDSYKGTRSVDEFRNRLSEEFVSVLTSDACSIEQKLDILYAKQEELDSGGRTRSVDVLRDQLSGKIVSVREGMTQSVLQLYGQRCEIKKIWPEFRVWKNIGQNSEVTEAELETVYKSASQALRSAKEAKLAESGQEVDVNKVHISDRDIYDIFATQLNELWHC